MIDRDYRTYRLVADESHNVRRIYATPAAFGRLSEALGDLIQVEIENESRRGRTPGSTNWSKERFWRRYARAAGQLSRPYRAVALAVAIGLNYATFKKYLALWGPPAGFRKPGD